MSFILFHFKSNLCRSGEERLLHYIQSSSRHSHLDQPTGATRVKHPAQGHVDRSPTKSNRGPESVTYWPPAQAPNCQTPNNPKSPPQFPESCTAFIPSSSPDKKLKIKENNNRKRQCKNKRHQGQQKSARSTVHV